MIRTNVWARPADSVQCISMRRADRRALVTMIDTLGSEFDWYAVVLNEPGAIVRGAERAQGRLWPWAGGAPPLTL